MLPKLPKSRTRLSGQAAFQFCPICSFFADSSFLPGFSFSLDFRGLWQIWRGEVWWEVSSAARALQLKVAQYQHCSATQFNGISIVQQYSALYSCTLQCTMCTLYSFFSSRPSAVRHILKSYYRHTIQHIFVPTRSVERNIEKIWFLWASNSKFVIFPQIFPPTKRVGTNICWMVWH